MINRISTKKVYRFYIISMNCDGRMCGHHYEARRREPSTASLTCEFCRESNYIGTWKVVGEVEASNRMEAVYKYRKELCLTEYQ